jgi:hypothetical protein
MARVVVIVLVLAAILSIALLLRNRKGSRRPSNAMISDPGPPPADVSNDTTVSAAQIQTYRSYLDRDLDMVERTGELKGESMREAWRVSSIVDGLRQKLFIVAKGQASAKFSDMAETELINSTTDEEARELIRTIVRNDVDAQRKA